MKKISINYAPVALLCVCLTILANNVALAQVSSATPTADNDYVVAAYVNNKYYALPNTTTNGGTLTGVEVTLNTLNKVSTTDASGKTWTLTSGAGDGQFKLSYTSSGNTYYLYKNGTGATNYNFKVSTGSNNDWSFSANGTGYTVAAVDRGSNNVNIQCNSGTFRCYSDASSIILLEIGDDESSPTCATPTFSVSAGTYYGAQSVELSCGTAGATIYYTTDGTTPTSSSIVYSSAIEISSTTTIKAIAIKDDYNDSEVASATYTIKSPVAGYVVDFEEAPEAYVDWEMSNIGIHTSGLTSAHSGSAWGSNVNGSDNAVGTASITTKNKVDYPDVFTCYISKESTNTTSSTWKIQVSSNGSDWDDIASLSSMTQNTWAEFTGDIKSERYTNVYVRLYYSGSNAKRAVDDISLTTYVPAAVEEPTISVSSEFTFSTTATISCISDGATIYYSFDNISWNEYTEPLNITSTTTIYAKATKGGDESTVAQATATKNLVNATVTISATTFDIGQTATVSSDGPVVTLSSSDASIASVEGTTVTGIAAGDVTITATWSASEDYNAGSKDFAISILDPNAPGSFTNPYSVAQAIDNTPASGTSDNVYIHGFVSAFYNTSIVGDGANYRYYISDDGTTNNQLLVYKGKGLGNVAFSSESDLLIGDEVMILGGLTTYNSTKEIAANNYIVSQIHAPSITIATTSIDIDAEEHEGTLAFDFVNIDINNASDFAIQFYDAMDSELDSEPNWFSAEVIEDAGDYSISYLVEENTTYEARFAYFKIFALGDEDYIYSDLVTLTQTGLVPPALGYATLPFTFTGGKGDIEDEDGLTHSDLGSDYSSTPKLKFDGTGDYLILHFNEVPGTLTFSIKGNSFSGGTFTVQTSTDGSSYTDLESYTSLSDTQSESFSNLSSDVRYIKWIYTEKSSGNVALGNIGLTKASAPETVELTGTLSDGRYWVSFFSDSRYTVSEGAKAFTMNSSYQLYQLGTDGSVIPANTAVILISDTADITLTKSGDDTEITVNGGGNILRGSTSPVAKYTISGTPYVLGIKGGELGFYEFTGDGIPAGKAYYEE